MKISSLSEARRDDDLGEQIDRALAFLDAHGRPVDAAWAAVACGRVADRREALAALATYQNPDGGFGHRLEPDITAPESNPFAASLALAVMLATGATPPDPVVARLGDWLVADQDEDGGWRFAPAVADAPMAPWFAGWAFPSLNPALSLVGQAVRLGLDLPGTFARTRALFDRLASLDAIPMATFYDLLPYVDHVPWVEHPERDAYLQACAARVEALAAEGAYEDAVHFFQHAGPPSGPIVGLLPPALVAAQLVRLRAEQREDGGWPTPYDEAWRSWVTAYAAATLVAFNATAAPAAIPQ